MHNLPSGNHKTAYFFDEQEKIVTSWLGSSESSTIFTIIVPSNFHSFQSLQNSLYGEKNFFPFPGRLQKAPGAILCSKRFNILGRWNYEVAWKMAESSGTKH